jgi:hypothetical protein
VSTSHRRSTVDGSSQSVNYTADPFIAHALGIRCTFRNYSIARSYTARLTEWSKDCLSTAEANYFRKKRGGYTASFDSIDAADTGTVERCFYGVTRDARDATAADDIGFTERSRAGVGIQDH